MCTFMHDSAIGRSDVFLPLVLNMNQRPLPAAEPKVLDPGKLEVVLLWIGYPMRFTVMPAGRAASSTVTV